MTGKEVNTMKDEQYQDIVKALNTQTEMSNAQTQYIKDISDTLHWFKILVVIAIILGILGLLPF